MRSGSAHCHVSLSEERIGTPLISHPDVLVAMNEISLRKFAQQGAPGGVILYNRDRLPPDFVLPPARVIFIPASEIADKLGSTKVTKLVLMGALLEETECLSPATAMGVAGDQNQETRPPGLGCRPELHRQTGTCRRRQPARRFCVLKRTLPRNVYPLASYGFLGGPDIPTSHPAHLQTFAHNTLS
jgi:hypothetical protein